MVAPSWPAANKKVNAAILVSIPTSKATTKREIKPIDGIRCSLSKIFLLYTSNPSKNRVLNCNNKREVSQIGVKMNVDDCKNE